MSIQAHGKRSDLGRNEGEYMTPFCNTSEAILRMAKADPRYRRVLEEVQAQAEFWENTFADDARRISGWGHDFVCPHCAGKLKWTPDFQPKGRYICTNCKAEAEGPKLDAAWVYNYRYASAKALSASALRYHVYEEAASLAYVIRYLDLYAESYSDFPVHGERAGKGKVMGQSLDEAVWALMLLSAMQICGKDHIPPEKLSFWWNALFLPMAHLLLPQADSIHNIPLWIRCAVGAIALFFEDDALLAQALDGEFGIREQIRRGYTADGLWYECSMGYHYYSTEALTLFLQHYRLRMPQDPLLDVLEMAYRAPERISPDGWSLPAMNDGWFPQCIGRYGEQILLAHRIRPTEVTAAQLRRMIRQAPDQFASIQTLLYLTELDPDEKEPERPDVEILESTCVAAVNRPMHVFLKAGAPTTSHMHMDCMSVSIPPFALDLGTCGYGHPATFSYFHRTLSHNTVTVDGKSHPRIPVPARFTRLPNGLQAEAEAYEGVRFVRTLTWEEDRLHDTFRIFADETHQYDWVFRSGGEAMLPQGGIPDSLTGEEECYAMLSDTLRYPACDAFTVGYALQGKKLCVTVSPETLGRWEIWTACMPANPMDQRNTALILRTRGANVTCCVTYCIC